MNLLNLPRHLCLTGAVVTLSALFGCASQAPGYNPNIDNVDALKRAKTESVKSVKVSVQPNLPGATTIGIRADNMHSSVGSNFGDYVADALKRELELAKLYDPQSDTEVSGELLKNDIDASGFSVGTGTISARFVVRRGSQVRYNSVKTVTHTWESSFIGATAIPKARESYTEMVQMLITTLVKDPDFVTALRK